MDFFLDGLSLTDGLRISFAAPFFVLALTVESVVSQVEVLGAKLQHEHDHPNDEHGYEGDEREENENHPD